MEERIIVRGSAEHQDYLKHQFGAIKEWVNGVETKLAISSRVLLMAYVIYISAKSMVQYALPQIPWLTYTLLGVDVIFLIIQSMGLEGARPGLIHLAQEMESNGKKDAAIKLMNSSNTVQKLMVATAVDIVLQGILAQTKTFGGFDLRWIIEGYTYILLIVRVWSVGTYLGEMAKLSHKGPKIISKAENEKQKQDQEQKRIEITNANIMQAIAEHSRPVLEAAMANFASQTQRMMEQFSLERAAMKAELEAMRVMAGQSLEMTEIQRLHRESDIRLSSSIESIQQTQDQRMAELSQWVEAMVSHQFESIQPVSAESIQRQVESMVSRSSSDLRQSFESRLESIQQDMQRQGASVELRRREAPAQPRQQSRLAATHLVSMEERNRARQAEPGTHLLSESGRTRDEVLVMIEADPDLARLSDAVLAVRVGSTKSTANRAKAEWKLNHPESIQGDSGEMEAITG